MKFDKKKLEGMLWNGQRIAPMPKSLLFSQPPGELLFKSWQRFCTENDMQIASAPQVYQLLKKARFYTESGDNIMGKELIEILRDPMRKNFLLLDTQVMKDPPGHFVLHNSTSTSNEIDTKKVGRHNIQIPLYPNNYIDDILSTQRSRMTAGPFFQALFNTKDDIGTIIETIELLSHKPEQFCVNTKPYLEKYKQGSLILYLGSGEDAYLDFRENPKGRVLEVKQ